MNFRGTRRLPSKRKKYRNRRKPAVSRRKSLAIFYERRSSAVENRLRFSTADGGSPPIPKESEETLLCRRKSQAIFDGRGRVPLKFIEFSGDNEKKDLRSFFLYFPRLRRSRGKSVLFLKEKGPEKKDLGFVFSPSGN